MNGIPKTHEEKLAAAKEYLRSRNKYLVESGWRPRDARHTDVMQTLIEAGFTPPELTKKGKRDEIE